MTSQAVHGGLIPRVDKTFHQLFRVEGYDYGGCISTFKPYRMVRVCCEHGNRSCLVRVPLIEKIHGEDDVTLRTVCSQFIAQGFFFFPLSPQFPVRRIAIHLAMYT